MLTRLKFKRALQSWHTQRKEARTQKEFPSITTFLFLGIWYRNMFEEFFLGAYDIVTWLKNFTQRCWKWYFQFNVLKALKEKRQRANHWWDSFSQTTTKYWRNTKYILSGMGNLLYDIIFFGIHKTIFNFPFFSSNPNFPIFVLPSHGAVRNQPEKHFSVSCK